MSKRVLDNGVELFASFVLVVAEEYEVDPLTIHTAIDYVIDRRNVEDYLREIGADIVGLADAVRRTVAEHIGIS